MIAYDMLGNWGELGNQFFEIAVTSVMAKKHDTVPKFPKWVCSKSHRPYSNILHIPLDETLNPSQIEGVWQEPDHSYHEVPFRDNITLRGYFQSEKYWTGYHDYVRNELLKPAQYIIDYLDTRYSDIINMDNTVAVHIRSQTRKQHDDLVNHMQPSTQYLKKAFDIFGKDAQYIIFSDNIPLMREWFSNYDFIFIENGTPYNNTDGEEPLSESTDDKPIYDNVIELFLMAQCKNAITTSSSFGWWGAWLMNNPDKHVVSMSEDMWFNGDLGLNLKDLIPESWEKIIL